MRTFEFILLLVVTILPFIKRPLIKRIPANFILAGIVVILTLHLLVEGWRWQMIPAYLLTLIVVWRIWRVDTSKPIRLSFLRAIGFVGLLAIAAVSWTFPRVLPVFSLPEPRGSQAVGTETVYVQTDRDEPITKNPDDKRELVFKIWYPSDADVSSSSSDIYIDQANRDAFALKYGLSPSMLNYLDQVKTHVYPEIQVAGGSFPVLIFSHGYGSKATGYYALLSEIASQGYVIINMNHTYESLGTSLPDGRNLYFDLAYQQEIMANSMEVVQPLRDAFQAGMSYEERHPIVREAVKGYAEAHIQDRWAEDIRYTLDLLEKWNNEGSLKGRLDLNRIGVFGHSVGGGTAGNVAMKDTRIKAAANLDGIQWGNQIDTLYHIPYLYLSADWPAEHEDVNSHIYIHKSSDYFYEAKLLRSGHPNFMDIPMMIPVAALTGSGEIDPYLGTEITTRLVTEFFDRHLKGFEKADPMRIGEAYELLEIQSYEGDSIR